MSVEYKNCQSCSMPLKQDPAGGGTNEDGSKSRIYCSYCYKDGKFLQPDVTAGEMQEFVYKKLREMRFPGFVARFFTRRIPTLERWKSPN